MQKAHRHYMYICMFVLLIVMSLFIFQGKQNDISSMKHTTAILHNEKDQNKILVAYFSATGNTLAIAETMAEMLDSDIYAITPLEPYTTEDLDYTNPNSRSSIEQNDTQSRPAMLKTVDNLESYDVMYLGYPLWHDKAPAIIATFLESNTFSGKTIIPFCTSHSSEIQASEASLQTLTNPSVKWIRGMRFSPQATQQEIQAWLDSIEL